MGEAAPVLSKDEQRVLLRLATDLPYLAEEQLKTVPKAGGKQVPLVFKRSQRHIHRIAEEQKAETGMVRLAIVKGRQQGCSEYVASRFSQAAVFQTAITVFILSHEKKSTKILFKKAIRFYKSISDALKPKLTAANREELELANDSVYGVGTAGAGATGRSNTAQRFHGSECAFWQESAEIISGALQAISDEDGTEVFLESTANGLNWWYKWCMDALAELNGYRLIFVPWYWQEEYRRRLPAVWELDDEERELMALYGKDGLTEEHLAWRRIKKVQLGSRLFKQEYPFHLQEAFQHSGNSFYDLTAVQRAMKSKLKSDYGAKILGVDVGRTGDRTVLVYRRGRQIIWIQKFTDIDSMELAGRIANLIDEYSFDKVFIDYGLGYGVVDRLRERGYKRIVEGIHFSASPTREQFLNLRAEMAFKFKEWLEDGEVSMPDDDDAASDIATMPEPKITSNSKFQFPKKDEIKEKHGRSPDILDAIMLTFAAPVMPGAANQGSMQTTKTKAHKKGSALTTRNRVKSVMRPAAVLPFAKPLREVA